MSFSVISTFSGCGGSSLGYQLAGGKVRLAVEWDNNAVETYRLNFPSTPIYHGDIAKLSVEKCLDLAGMQPGELDIFDGSPPCQGFSTAGTGLLHWAENKFLSIPEMAQIASFGTEYKWSGTPKNAVERIGNSVPPNLMQAIAEHIRDNILAKCGSS